MSTGAHNPLARLKSQVSGQDAAHVVDGSRALPLQQSLSSAVPQNMPSNRTPVQQLMPYMHQLAANPLLLAGAPMSVGAAMMSGVVAPGVGGVGVGSAHAHILAAPMGGKNLEKAIDETQLQPSRWMSIFPTNNDSLVHDHWERKIIFDAQVSIFLFYLNHFLKIISSFLELDFSKLYLGLMRKIAKLSLKISTEAITFFKK